MRTHPWFGTQFLLGLVVVVVVAVVVAGLGCGGTMDTGTAARPVNNKPADDGTCPNQRTLCGTGRFAVCVNLQDDAENCGACARACSPGIACQAGVCAQTLCTGSALPFSGPPTTGAPHVADWPALTAWQLLADVNGDGHLDLVDWTVPRVYPPPDSSAFRVSLGQPGGGFAASDTYHASANVLEIFVTDANDDGSDDLWVFARIDSNTVVQSYRVELWLGNHNGQLTRAEAPGMTGEMTTSMIAMGDLSGDGWPDLVMQTPDTDYNHASSISVYLSDSTGALHLSQSYLAGWGSAAKTIIKDWDGDGSPDLLVMGGGVLIFYNRGDGNFDPPVNCGLNLGVPMGGDVLVEDFNRDGKPDLALSFTRGRVGVMLGTGGCGLSPIAYYAVGGTFMVDLLRAADMNGDGIVDIISTRVVTSAPSVTGSVVIEDNLLAVLLGELDGTFTLADPVISLGPGTIPDVLVGEVSGDHRPDILVTSPEGHTRTWENTCQ